MTGNIRIDYRLGLCPEDREAFEKLLLDACLEEGTVDSHLYYYRVNFKAAYIRRAK